MLTLGTFCAYGVCFIDTGCTKVKIAFDAHHKDVDEFQLVPRLIGVGGNNILNIRSLGALYVHVAPNYMEIHARSMRKLMLIWYILIKADHLLGKLENHFERFRKRTTRKSWTQFCGATNPSAILPPHNPHALFRAILFTDNPPKWYQQACLCV